MPLEQPKMRTKGHASKIENSPTQVGYDVRDCALSYPSPPLANTGSSCGLGCILASEHDNVLITTAVVIIKPF